MVRSQPVRGESARAAALLSLLATVSMASGACKPEFAERYSNIAGPRVLAVKSDPAEENPVVRKTDVQYSVLFVDQTGPRDDATIDWAFCTDATPPNELNEVSSTCLATSGSQLRPLSGSGVTASGPVPDNGGCRQFGPSPPQTDGGPPGRPADPDPTGGYYQPVRLIVSASPPITAIGETRLHCDLAGATSDVQRDYANRYKDNENPSIEALTTLGSNQQEVVPYDGSTPSLSVGVGQQVDLRLSWPACDTNVPCPPDAMERHWLPGTGSMRRRGELCAFRSPEPDHHRTKRGHARLLVFDRGLLCQ